MRDNYWKFDDLYTIIFNIPLGMYIMLFGEVVQ